MSRVARLLNSSAEVWRSSRTPDGIGGWTEGWAQVSTVRARFSQPSAAERTVNERTEARMTHVVFLRADADVRRGDELRSSGRTFDVLAVFEPSVPGTYLRADCAARQASQ
ncbi:head-tail adaptor protein [Streptomyces sp. NPDC015414]|uniref:head-tail adaptor protein n=1 Tax=Streptomyces sp. NPDC015414 TaxID=3364957 RepID=UPI0036F6DE1D